MAKQITPERGEDMEFELVYLIGVTIQGWANIEALLTAIFTKVLEPSDSGMAVTIMESVIAFEARLKMIEACFLRRSDFAHLQPVALKIFLDCRAKSGKRSQIAHAVVTHVEIDDRYQGPVLLPYGSVLKNHRNTLDAKQMRERIDSFKRLHDGLRWLWAEMGGPTEMPEGSRLELPDRYRA